MSITFLQALCQWRSAGAGGRARLLQRFTLSPSIHQARSNLSADSKWSVTGDSWVSNHTEYFDPNLSCSRSCSSCCYTWPPLKRMSWTFAPPSSKTELSPPLPPHCSVIQSWMRLDDTAQQCWRWAHQRLPQHFCRKWLAVTDQTRANLIEQSHRTNLLMGPSLGMGSCTGIKFQEEDCTPLMLWEQTTPKSLFHSYMLVVWSLQPAWGRRKPLNSFSWLWHHQAQAEGLSRAMLTAAPALQVKLHLSQLPFRSSSKTCTQVWKRKRSSHYLSHRISPRRKAEGWCLSRIQW